MHIIMTSISSIELKVVPTMVIALPKFFIALLRDFFADFFFRS